MEHDSLAEELRRAGISRLHPKLRSAAFKGTLPPEMYPASWRQAIYDKRGKSVGVRIFPPEDPCTDEERHYEAIKNMYTRDGRQTFHDIRAADLRGHWLDRALRLGREENPPAKFTKPFLEESVTKKETEDTQTVATAAGKRGLWVWRWATCILWVVVLLPWIIEWAVNGCLDTNTPSPLHCDPAKRHWNILE